MELKHIRNYQEGDDHAVMLLYSDTNIEESRWFAQEMRFLNENGVKSVDIHINSGGGQVMGALSIVAAIRNFDGHVCTINDGIAASSAGFVFASGHTRKMLDFARVMLHDPSHVDGQADEKTMNALNEIKEMIIAIFQSNTSLSSDEINDIMTRETWLNAQEALSMGMIDEIISSSREAVDMIDNLIAVPDLSLAAIMNVTKNLAEKKQIFNHEPKIHKMEKVKNHLGLDASSKQEDVVTSIQNIQTDLAKYKNKSEKLEADLAAEKTAKENAEAKVLELERSSREAVVDGAIDSGLFDKEKRDEMIKQAEQIGLENFKNLLSSIKSTPVSITDQLEKGKEGNVDKTMPEKFQNKTFRDIEKMGAEGEKFLNELKNSNPEKYKQMFEAQYGVEA